MFREYYPLQNVPILAVLTSRYSAIGHMILREAGEDTTLTIPNPTGQPGSETISISKGTKVNAVYSVFRQN